MDIAKRLKQLMEINGNLTEYRVYKESGVPQSTLSGILSGNSYPSIPTLETLCSYFHITPAQFFTDPDTERLYPLSDEEKKFIEKWHTLSDEKKEALAHLIDVI